MADLGAILTTPPTGTLDDSSKVSAPTTTEHTRVTLYESRTLFEGLPATPIEGEEYEVIVFAAPARPKIFGG